MRNFISNFAKNKQDCANFLRINFLPKQKTAARYKEPPFFAVRELAYKQYYAEEDYFPSSIFSFGRWR